MRRKGHSRTWNLTAMVLMLPNTNIQLASRNNLSCILLSFAVTSEALREKAAIRTVGSGPQTSTPSIIVSPDGRPVENKSDKDAQMGCLPCLWRHTPNTRARGPQSDPGDRAGISIAELLHGYCIWACRPARRPAILHLCGSSVHSFECSQVCAP